MTKYEKYLIREPIHKDPMGPTLHVDARNFVPDVAFPITLDIMGWHDPKLLLHIPPHSHDFDHVFFFLGGNPRNFFDADFEVEMWLGEEGEREKIIINTPSVLYVPKGMLHCPLILRKANKPIFYGKISLTGKYERTRGGREDVEKITKGEWVIRPYTPEEVAKLKAGILIPHGPTT